MFYREMYSQFKFTENMKYKFAHKNMETDNCTGKIHVRDIS